ncbi:hypothetical protein LINPERHAP2_LOCUS9209 [Linum perenne]
MGDFNVIIDNTEKEGGLLQEENQLNCFKSLFSITSWLT